MENRICARREHHHQGHVLEREDPGIASYTGGRDKDKPI